MKAAVLAVLSNRVYRHLFLAQLIALVGTGLATVALGLLAYDLAGGNAGAVLGTALAIKMAAYIGVAPVVGAFSDRLPRRALLVAMDLVRAAVALCLPFVDQIWQIYILIFALQSASAAFTPTFQATIPEVLPDERDYTRALSLSRLAYDMESLTSPILAAALLTIINFHWLFAGTAVGFVCSALLVVSVALPAVKRASDARTGIYEKTTRGLRIYLKTPRLRGLLALTFASAAASSMVIVNTVVIVRDQLGRSQSDVAIALAAFGGGSMLAALLLPRVLDRISDRRVMIFAAAILAVALSAMTIVTLTSADAPGYWIALLAGWAVLGVAYSTSVTPTGRLLKRSAQSDDRPTLFAAQFALSHACWLVTYPLAGWLGAQSGQIAAFGAMAAIAAAGTIAAAIIWPRVDVDALTHSHDDLPDDHPHLVEAHGGKRNAAHGFTIDPLHTRWPVSNDLARRRP